MAEFDGLFTKTKTPQTPKAGEFSGLFTKTAPVVPPTPLPGLLGTTTISQAPPKPVPFGFVGRAVKAAYDVTKNSVESSVQKVLSAFNASDASGVNLNTSEKAPGFSKYNVDGTPNPNYQKELTARQDFIANTPKETKLTRATSITSAGLSFANLYPPIAIFNAELAAAKELPGPLSYPAKAVDYAFQKVGELGGTGIGLGIDKLQKDGVISQETSDKIKPLSQELASFVTLIVGTHLGFKAMELGFGKGLDKLPISDKAKANINKGVQLGVGFSMQPFSTAYGLTTNLIATKIQERKARGVEITPEEGKRIIEEVKKELPAEIANSDQVPTTPTTEFSGIFEGQNAPVEAPVAPKSAPGEAIVPKVDAPLTPEARKYKSAEDYIKNSLVDENTYRKEIGYSFNPANTKGRSVLRNQEIPIGKINLERPNIKIASEENATGKVAKASSDINTNITKKGFDELSPEQQAQYTPITKADQIQKVADLIQKDYGKARNMALGKEPITGDINSQVIFNAVKNKALAEGDVATLRDLASSPIAQERSIAAQKLGASGFDNGVAEGDPVKAIQDVIKSREKSAKSKGISADTKDTVKEIKDSIKKSAPTKETWTSFVDSITC